MQDPALGQATPATVTLDERAGAGMDWAAQVVPFHTSASGVWEPTLLNVFPTAMQDVALVQLTASNTPPRFGAAPGPACQVVPFHTSASGSWLRLSGLELPTAMHMPDPAHVIPDRVSLGSLARGGVGVSDHPVPAALAWVAAVCVTALCAAAGCSGAACAATAGAADDQASAAADTMMTRRQRTSVPVPLRSSRRTM